MSNNDFATHFVQLFVDNLVNLFPEGEILFGIMSESYI